MKLGIVIYSTDSESVWNAFRLGVFALQKDDSVQIFLLANGVECESLNTEKFNVTEQMQSGWTQTGASGNGTYNPTDGSIVDNAETGYTAANIICAAQFTGSHFCSEGEIIASIANLTSGEKTARGWAGMVWVATGGAKFVPATANDCEGWTNGTSSFYGTFWNLSTDIPLTGTCDSSNTLSLACCQ